MPITEIKSATRGLIGYLHEVECKSNDSVLIFQLPRETRHLSNVYLEEAKSAIDRFLPEGRSALIIGCDVNIYEIAGPDALMLKIKTLI